jgi:dolichyl-diphosphooligosaccharide--protein glycosyltransferase
MTRKSARNARLASSDASAAREHARREHSHSEHAQGEHSHREHTRRERNASDSSDDVSIDFSSITSFFRRLAPGLNMETAIAALFIVFAVLLVFHVRMLPVDLPATESWAEQAIRQNIQAQVSADIDRRLPALPQANRDAMVQEEVEKTISSQQAAFDATIATVSQQFKDYLRYTAEDGKEYTYLGDLDSYFWLRYTRNLYRHGHVCDAVVEGECRDQYVLAPVGAPTSFNPSLHVFAIYWLHRIVTLWNPGFPLLAASFMIPVILGIVGVFPAFFIGRRLAGNVGGIFAAILVSLNPLVLSRSMGSDNDVWNITVPLFLLWFAVEALAAKQAWKVALWSALAGIAVGVHAAAWDGYWFIYLIVFFALIGNFVYKVLNALAHKEYTVWQNRDVVIASIVLGVFYVAAFLAVLIAGKGGNYVQLPLLVTSASTGLDRAIMDNYWPNVLTTVAELNKADLSGAIGNLGGKWLFFASLTGIVLLLLPRTAWKLRHYLFFAAGATAVLLLVNLATLSTGWILAFVLVTIGLILAGLSIDPKQRNPYLLGAVAVAGITLCALILGRPIDKFTTTLLLALPTGIILLAHLFEKDDFELGPALLVLVWYMATVYATYSGIRFVLLMVPAFAVGFAVVAGRAYEWCSSYLARQVPWHRWITNALVFGLIAMLLIQPIRAGRDTASTFVPSIDDAWWNGLTKIRDESAPDAIINSWWDFGHWFKYVADRRVTADGTTQHTHAPRWLGLALVTPDEQEAIGVLRMLNCGNDAFPGQEGWEGAYGRTLNVTQDPIKSEEIVRQIVGMDSELRMKSYLSKQGISEADQERILERVTCESPEDYFITSGDMIGKAGVWAHFGLWNFTKAYVAQTAKDLPRDEAVADLTARFGLSVEEAEQLYFDARTLRTEGEINQFAAPWPGYLTGSWVSCQRRNETIACPLGFGVGQQGSTQTVIEGFIVNTSNTSTATFQFAGFQNGRKVTDSQSGRPGEIVLAFEDGMARTVFQNASTPGIGVLVDVPNNRILLADPLLLRSTFTHLYFLDGRYSNHFEKFYDAQSFTGSRVVIWKVNWEGIDADRDFVSSTARIVAPEDSDLRRDEGNPADGADSGADSAAEGADGAAEVISDSAAAGATARAGSSATALSENPAGQ